MGIDVRPGSEPTAKQKDMGVMMGILQVTNPDGTTRMKDLKELSRTDRAKLFNYVDPQELEQIYETAEDDSQIETKIRQTIGNSYLKSATAALHGRMDLRGRPIPPTMKELEEVFANTRALMENDPSVGRLKPVYDYVKKNFNIEDLTARGDVWSWGEWSKLYMEFPDVPSEEIDRVVESALGFSRDMMEYMEELKNNYRTDYPRTALKDVLHTKFPHSTNDALNKMLDIIYAK